MHMNIKNLNKPPPNELTEPHDKPIVVESQSPAETANKRWVCAYAYARMFIQPVVPNSCEAPQIGLGGSWVGSDSGDPLQMLVISHIISMPPLKCTCP